MEKQAFYLCNLTKLALHNPITGILHPYQMQSTKIQTCSNYNLSIGCKRSGSAFGCYYECRKSTINNNKSVNLRI